jgi:hypothetical protein
MKIDNCTSATLESPPFSSTTGVSYVMTKFSWDPNRWESDVEVITYIRGDFDSCVRLTRFQARMMWTKLIDQGWTRK